MRNIILLTVSLLVGGLVYGQDKLPRVINFDNQIIEHAAYTLSYNETCEQPNWVKYQITKEDLENPTAKRKNNFKVDLSIVTGSADLLDYKGSGYDRGHLAPAATFVGSQKEMDESFFMSNISPQNPSFNRGIWKRIEAYERLAAKDKGSVYVITGPILNKDLKTIGANKVCVPEFYYKIIYVPGGWSIGFLIKNEKSSEALYMFKQPIKIIEREAKINFMLD